MNQQVALAQLKKLGYASDAVANGLEVLEALSRIPYDIILMDCQMPELDGYETTRQVRERGGHQPYVIAMTASAMQGDRELCLAAGMDDYITKPVRTAALRVVLEKQCEIKGNEVMRPPAEPEPLGAHAEPNDLSKAALEEAVGGASAAGSTHRTTTAARMTVPIVSLLICLLTVLPAWSAEIRLNGATTCVNSVINPYRGAVEKATGHTLKIVGNATGKGLLDLAEDRCDASLTSEPLDIAAEAAKMAGRSIDVAEYQIHIVKYEAIVFVVHPSNPVDALTHEQIKRIHTGKITNWKEVGGPDLSIIVLTDALTGGTRAMVKRIILQDEPYAATCRVLDSVRLVNLHVAELRGGCGAIGASFIDLTKVKIIQTEAVVRPLGFITRGEPTEPLKQILGAFLTEAARDARSVPQIKPTEPERNGP